MKRQQMSALGHKQIFAAQKAMSALPIATAKANSRKKSGLLYTGKRTGALHWPMPAKGQ